MTTIQDPLNSSQTPTMANFATLADALAGCVSEGQARMHASKFVRGRKRTEGQHSYGHVDRG